MPIPSACETWFHGADQSTAFVVDVGCDYVVFQWFRSPGDAFQGQFTWHIEDFTSWFRPSEPPTGQ